MKSTPPDAIGTWGDIFYRLEKLQRRQRDSRSELTNALEQFEHAATAVPDGMVILNGSDQIEWCNPASRKYMGLDCERDRGQFIRYLLRQAHFLEFLDAADYSRRLVCKSPINREITLSLQLVPFGEGKKLLVARDITELERVDAMRRDFIANVSHELRTPLTVVGGFRRNPGRCARPAGQRIAPLFRPDAGPYAAHAAPAGRPADPVAAGKRRTHPQGRARQCP